jgi:hypothetical protein
VRRHPLLHAGVVRDAVQQELAHALRRVPGEARSCGGEQKRRVVTFRGLARRDRKWPLNDGQIPNPNVVRVAPGSDYRRVEGNRRASRNGRVSDLPPETPTTIRNLFIGGRHMGAA